MSREIDQELGLVPQMPTRFDKVKARELLEQLADLIDSWNDAQYEEDERGRGNEALCLIIGEEGAGYLGTLNAKPPEELFNTQLDFNEIDELVEFLGEWIE